MSKRALALIGCLVVCLAAAWVGGRGTEERQPPAGWTEVVPGVLRSPGLPGGFALLDGNRALLIDAPCDAAGLRQRGVERVDMVLLTHHHRDSCAAVGAFLREGVPVRAARASAAWLEPEPVRKYWQESLPLRNSRTAYLVVPEGVDGIDCTLADGQTIDWRGWSLQVIATPGHSQDHLAFAARQVQDGDLLLFSGDACASRGKMWSPYTTDWDHWTDAGLKPAGQSLRKLAALRPAVVLSARDRQPVAGKPREFLETAAAQVEEMAFLKSFERYSKERLGDAPRYRFLAPDQVASNGSKPWSRVSEHLFNTGNTYVLTSKDGPFLVLDPWAQRSVDQIARLQTDQKLGPLEVVMFSHAHYDHYDGIYDLPGRDRFQVWSLDVVAAPLIEPYRWRAPFLDARPVKFDRQFKDGETASWREYRFRFVHLPGQSAFSMGIETVIDGKKCFFTADNFFHQDQFSGTGGWMGLNRSFPLPYAASARQVLEAAPDWVLAEHGGPFEFNAEDFRRRVKWGEVSAAAADALSPSGNHRCDWDPHRVHVEPLLFQARPGATLRGELIAANPLDRDVRFAVTLRGRGIVDDQHLAIAVPRDQTMRQPIVVRLPMQLRPGRHVFCLEVNRDGEPDPVDAFVAVDIAP